MGTETCPVCAIIERSDLPALAAAEHRPERRLCPAFLNEPSLTANASWQHTDGCLPPYSVRHSWLVGV